MADIYKIGVAISATNGMSSVLGVIARDVMGLEKSVAGLNRGFSAARVAIGGMAAAMAGGAMLAVMGKMVEHGITLVHQQALFKEQFREMPGMTLDKLNAMTAEATTQAYKTASEVLTSNVTENLKSLRELVGVFGDLKDAKENLTTVTRAQMVMNTLVGKDTGDQVFAMAKALEIKGASIDPKRFNELLDLMVKASVASGGKVLGSDFFSAFKYGRTATMGWDDKFVGQYLPTLIQEMKGGGGGGGVGGPGNALQSVFQAVVGGVLSHKAISEFSRLHLLDESMVLRTSTGAAKGVKPGGVEGSAEFQANPYAWVQDHLLPALQKAGITTPEAIRTEVANLFTNRTAQQMVTMFATQQTRFEKDAALNRGASGVGAADTLITNDPTAKIKAFHAAWENLMTSLGAPLVDTATNLLMKLTHAINDFGVWASTHQELVRYIGLVAGGMAALAVALGVFAIGGAAAMALGVLAGPAGLLVVAAGLVALAGAIPVLFPETVKALAAALNQVPGAVEVAKAAILNLLTFGISGAIDGAKALLDAKLPKLPGVLGGGGGTPGASPNAPWSGKLYGPHGNTNPDGTGKQSFPVVPGKQSWNVLPPANDLFPPRDSPSSFKSGRSDEDKVIKVAIVDGGVHIKNPGDIGRSMTNGFSEGASRPMSGPSYHDYRYDLPAPGLGALA